MPPKAGKPPRQGNGPTVVHDHVVVVELKRRGTSLRSRGSLHRQARRGGPSPRIIRRRRRENALSTWPRRPTSGSARSADHQDAPLPAHRQARGRGPPPGVPLSPRRLRGTVPTSRSVTPRERATSVRVPYLQRDVAREREPRSESAARERTAISFAWSNGPGVMSRGVHDRVFRIPSAAAARSCAGRTCLPSVNILGQGGAASFAEPITAAASISATRTRSRPSGPDSCRFRATRRLMSSHLQPTPFITRRAVIIFVRLAGGGCGPGNAPRPPSRRSSEVRRRPRRGKGSGSAPPAVAGNARQAQRSGAWTAIRRIASHGLVRSGERAIPSTSRGSLELLRRVVDLDHGALLGGLLPRCAV